MDWRAGFVTPMHTSWMLIGHKDSQITWWIFFFFFYYKWHFIYTELWKYNKYCSEEINDMLDMLQIFLIRKLTSTEKRNIGKYITLICRSHVKLGVWFWIKWLVRKDGLPDLSARPGHLAQHITKQKHWCKSVTFILYKGSCTSDWGWKLKKNHQSTNFIRRKITP